MNEKLQKICEEILQDENKSKRFIALQTPEEMYDYFKEKVPELTEDEFDGFVVEALDKYVSMQEKPEIITETLDKVTGGVNLGKFSKQIVAGAMAMLSLGSAAMASNTQTTTFGSNINTVKTQNAIKPTGKFQKITNWIKNHKAISTLVGAGILIGGTLVVKHFFIDKKDNNKEISQPDTPYQIKIPKTGDPELDKKIEDKINYITKENATCLKNLESAKQEIDKIIHDTVEEVNVYFRTTRPNAGTDTFLHFESGKGYHWTMGQKDEDSKFIEEKGLDKVFEEQQDQDKLKTIIQEANSKIQPKFTECLKAHDTRNKHLKNLLGAEIDTLEFDHYDKREPFENITREYITKCANKQEESINIIIGKWKSLAWTLTTASGNDMPSSIDVRLLLPLKLSPTLK